MSQGCALQTAKTAGLMDANTFSVYILLVPDLHFRTMGPGFSCIILVNCFRTILVARVHVRVVVICMYCNPHCSGFIVVLSTSYSPIVTCFTSCKCIFYMCINGVYIYNKASGLDIFSRFFCRGHFNAVIDKYLATHGFIIFVDVECYIG